MQYPMKSIMKANNINQSVTEYSRKPNSNKVVTFSPKARMRIVHRLTSPCYYPCNEEEEQDVPYGARKRDLWYSQRELEKRAKKDFAIICLMNEQQSDTIVTSHNKSICTRGLETQTTVGYRKKIHSRTLAKQAVFGCQTKHQRSSGNDDSVTMRIAQVYSKYTNQSMIDAIQMAKYDEQCVYNYNNNSQQKIVVSTTIEEGNVNSIPTTNSSGPPKLLFDTSLLRYSTNTPSIHTRHIHNHHHQQHQQQRLSSLSLSSSCPPSKRQRITNCIPKSASAPSLTRRRM